MTVRLNSDEPPETWAVGSKPGSMFGFDGSVVSEVSKWTCECILESAIV